MNPDEENPAIYFSLIAVFGGLGLLTSFLIEKKQVLDREFTAFVVEKKQEQEK
jgi:hypothetical protein